MAKLINISDATSIAIHSMAIVSNNEGMVNANLIAEKTGFSKNHVAKILQILVRNSYLGSTRGPKGGFHLKKDPKDVSLFELYELIEGKLEITHCQRDFDKCPFSDCVFGDIRQKLALQFKSYFKERKLSDIVSL